VDTISISQFKATCLAALERVRTTGQPLLVTRRGLPVAKIVPPPPAVNGASGFGAMSGRAEEIGNLVDPLDEADWEVLG